MQWINEKDLLKWSQRKDARVLLIDMVADLIRATIPAADRYRFRFPGGDSGELRGWDGDLETTEAVGYIPDRKSKWEFGAGAGARKASADYKKRTKKTSVEDMKENALVLVNLEEWDTPREMLTKWENDRKKENKWRDVRYIDAVTLVHWLDEHPAVAAKYAREVLDNAPQEGALSTDEYWAEFSSQFKPRLTEKVVIGDRQKVADELISKLLGPPGSIIKGAETAEDVIAFAVAAIRNSEPEKRRLLESRTLIIRTESAARELSRKSGMIFIATKGAESLAGVLSTNCPTLSAAIGTSARRYDPLQRPSASSMAEGFLEMGLDRDDGYELAQRCGRSLTILKRLIPGTPPSQPEWAPQSGALKSAFLAGGWSSNLSMDRDLVRDLGGFNNYSDLDSVLMPMLSLSDRPIDRVAEIWQTRAPVDAFYFYGHQITDADLQRLREAVVKVFGHAPTPPARNEKFSLNYVAPSDYSSWLRDGLALTLVIIAAMHGIVGLHVNGKTPQQYVDEIVSALPDWGRNHESLIRLGDQAALFAEAAPNPFLRALESMLEGSSQEVSSIFENKNNELMGASSPHFRILWALESIAWDPRYLERAALVLAKLAELDPEPESNYVNRPINSLRAILLGWSPSTYATQAQRLACLDSILRTVPKIGWQLLVKLLPRTHDSTSSTHHPKIRDLAPKIAEEITFGLVWDFEAAIVDRALSAAGANEGRIELLIKSMSEFQPESRSLVLSTVDAHLKNHKSPDGGLVWHTLNDEAARHNYFADAEWALAPEERSTIATIIENHRPSDPLVNDRLAFDDWLPHIGKYQANGDGLDPEEIRKEVLERVFLREGVPGILRLANMVKLPNLIGPVLRYTSMSMEQMFELLEGVINANNTPPEFKFYISAAGAAKFGISWKKLFVQRVLTGISDDAVKVQLLLGWDQNEETWTVVDSLGEDIRKQYWLQVNSLPIHGTPEQLAFAIEQFRRYNRDIDVIGLIYTRITHLPQELIQELLVKGISQIDKVQYDRSGMLSHSVAQALTELRGRNDVSEVDIAKIEYAYLPILNDQPLSIIKLISRTPSIFVEILSDVFRKKNSPASEEVSNEVAARARASHRLLRTFKQVPGLVGEKVDYEALNSWVSEARCLAAEKDRAEVCDSYIGQILAHSPLDSEDSLWPPTAVIKVIEGTASSDLERGFISECFNKRGVYSKAINEGGDQERALAAQYQHWAERAHPYPRTSSVLSTIADRWIVQSIDEDTRAEQGKMKW